MWCGSEKHPVHKELMKQCAWCNKVLSGPYEGSILPALLPEASHGFCHECACLIEVEVRERKVRTLHKKVQQAKFAKIA